VARRASEIGERVAQKPATSAKRYVLVVDDNEAIRETTVEILRVAGHKVIDAADFADALELLDEGHVSLLVLDLGLPTGRGWELLDQVAEPPPVILISGLGEPPPPDPRVSVYLSKPFTPERLMAEAARLTGQDGNRG
jgi:CheY-like chemotaxis protein